MLTSVALVSLSAPLESVMVICCVEMYFVVADIPSLNSHSLLTVVIVDVPVLLVEAVLTEVDTKNMKSLQLICLQNVVNDQSAILYWYAYNL